VKEGVEAQLMALAAQPIDLEAELKKFDLTATVIRPIHKDTLADCILSEPCKSIVKELYTQFRWASEVNKPLHERMKEIADGTEACAFIADPVCVRAGRVSASATLLQSFWRQLREGEVREQLVRKCVRAMNPDFRGPLMRPFVCVSAAASEACSTDGGDTAVPQAAAPPIFPSTSAEPPAMAAVALPAPATAEAPAASAASADSAASAKAGNGNRRSAAKQAPPPKRAKAS
jgi:hypothetical protein